MSEIVDLINEQIKRKFIEGIFTSLPAKVLKVSDYQNLQVVDVQPLIGTIEEDGVELVPPIIYNVPVILLGGGGALISIPLDIEDTVLLMFSMKDISTWQKGEGSYTVADSTRLHNINDAIAVTGLYANKSTLKPDPNDVVIKFKSSEIRIAADDTATIKADKISIGDGTNELLSIVDTLIDKLIAAQVLDPISGALPFNPATITELNLVKTKLANIKV